MFFLTSSTGREPTANGRAAQATVRALELCTTAATSGFLHGLLPTFTAKRELASTLELSANLACMDLGLQASNV